MQADENCFKCVPPIHLHFTVSVIIGLKKKAQNTVEPKKHQTQTVTRKKMLRKCHLEIHLSSTSVLNVLRMPIPVRGSESEKRIIKNAQDRFMQELLTLCL